MSGVRALVWEPHLTAAQIAVADHGSLHDAETPDAQHCYNVQQRGGIASMVPVPSIFLYYLGQQVYVGMLLV